MPRRNHKARKNRIGPNPNPPKKQKKPSRRKLPDKEPPNDTPEPITASSIASASGDGSTIHRLPNHSRAIETVKVNEAVL